MDDRLKEELAAWLEFYRDLGMEEFYRREPDAGIELGSTKLETGISAEAPIVAAALPAPEARLSGPKARTAVISPPPIELSLFEAPPPPPRARETLDEIRADEDEQGLPFVGRAGKLLNRMIQAVGMKREEVYICNIVKCRPPGNRTPEKDEVDACSPFLFRQLQSIQPRLICCLGSPAMKTLLGIKEGITRVRGQFFDYGMTKAFVAYHTAYILRNPREEKVLREDFETIREFLKAST
jgi:uracil-DNA glycosylase family 4